MAPQQFIVSTERLGTPGGESGRLERSGIVQRQLVYPTDSNRPTATCHLQRGERTPAICGYQWEGLVGVPGAASFDDVPEALRCSRCLAALERESA